MPKTLKTPHQVLVSHLPNAQAFYTLPFAARLIGCSDKHMRRLVRAGDIHSVRIHPSAKRSRLRIPRTELAKLLSLRAT